MKEVNESLLKANPDSLMHRCTAARMMVLLNPDQKKEALSLIADSPSVRAAGGGEACEGVPVWRLLECVEVQKVLEGELADKATADSKGTNEGATPVYFLGWDEWE